MKLEVNTNGAWRTILRGLSDRDAERYRQATLAATMLAAIDAELHPDKSQCWRLVDDAGAVLSYCVGATGWTERAA